MSKVLIATCEQLPNLDPDDWIFVDALRNLGVQALPAVWSDATVDWTQSVVCVVRSTWDYHRKQKKFYDWVEKTRRLTQLLNPAHAIHWNSHKFYLRRLQEAGVPIVPTYWLERGAVADLDALLQQLGWSQAVLKPAFGASADGIFMVTPDCQSREQVQLYMTNLLRREDALLQPFLSTVFTRPERALVFINGRYSHAVKKMPFMHANADIARRADLPPGASGELPVEATDEEIGLARRALDASPAGHVFARVDIVRDDDSPCVLEVELIEPTLYLYTKPSAAEDLARAIIDRMVA